MTKRRKRERVRPYYFTFGDSHKDRYGESLGSSYVVIHADNKTHARNRMFNARGASWAFVYDSAFEAGVETFKLTEKSLDEVTVPLR